MIFALPMGVNRKSDKLQSTLSGRALVSPLFSRKNLFDGLIGIGYVSPEVEMDLCGGVQ